MAIKFVDLDVAYNIKTDDEDIIVEVKTGTGQDGNYSVILGRKFISANEPANLGKKAAVSGKVTLVINTVADTLVETNLTSSTVTIVEGTNRTKFGPFSAMAEAHNDTVIYTIKIYNT